MEALKPQDIVVVLKLCVAAYDKRVASRMRTMAAVGVELEMSPSEVHAAIRRARVSGLLRPVAGSRRLTNEEPNVTAITEFLVHGIKYVFPPTRGELTRGVPTSYAAPPLRKLITRSSEPIPVWPLAEGKHRGMALEPLYPSVPAAAMRDRELYELLAITDALREGRARERRIAHDLLKERLGRIRVE